MAGHRALIILACIAAIFTGAAPPCLARPVRAQSPRASAVSRPLPAAARQRLRHAAGAVDVGHAAAVISDLRDLARDYPRSPEVAETLGLALIQLRSPSAALPFLRRAAQLAPASAAVLANLGITELRLGHSRPGISALRRAVALNPGDFDNVFNLGQALAASQQYARAAHLLARAHALLPDRTDVAYDWAWAEHRSGNDAMAKAALASVPALAQSASAQSLWGAVAEARGHYQAAARHLETAARLAPTEANYLALGIEFLRHLTWHAARVVFQDGLQHYPRSQALRTALGVTEFGQSDFTAAAMTFARLAAAHPASAFLAAMLGRSCLQGGISTQGPCQQLLAQAAAQPQNATAAAYAAVILLRSRSGPASAARALRLAEHSVRQDPRLAEARFAAGLALGRAGRWSQSIPQFQAALTHDPGDITTVYQLALAYQRTGQPVLAKKMLRRHAQMAADQRRATNRRLARIRQFVTQIGQPRQN